jgi:hypothetical protein
MSNNGYIIAVRIYRGYSVCVIKICVIFTLPRCPPAPAGTGNKECKNETWQWRTETSHLHKGLGALQEMLFALRLRSFLMPVDDGLIGNAILVV